jgi:hypothetical protein
VPVHKTLEMMEKTVGTAIDPLCFEALQMALARLDREAALAA